MLKFTIFGEHFEPNILNDLSFVFDYWNKMHQIKRNSPKWHEYFHQKGIYYPSYEVYKDVYWYAVPKITVNLHYLHKIMLCSVRVVIWWWNIMKKTDQIVNCESSEISNYRTFDLLSIYIPSKIHTKLCYVSFMNTNYQTVFFISKACKLIHSYGRLSYYIKQPFYQKYVY